MTRFVVVLMAVAAIFLAVGLPGERAVEAASHPGATPLLTCPDVVPGGGVTLFGDIFKEAAKFNKNYPDPEYHLLYDVNGGEGQITLFGDIFFTASKFNQPCPAVDTQIARATLAIFDPTYMDVWCDPALTTSTNCGGSAQFLTEDVTFLSSRGYVRGSTDVSGQGIHYVNFSLWDGVFNPARPEGLVYNNGKLAAQLYYSDADVIGWGCTPGSGKPTGCGVPPPGNQVNVDGMTPAASSCPTAPLVGCSWADSEDLWHWHKWLCTVFVGTFAAAAIPGDAVPFLLPGYAASDPNGDGVVDNAAECTGSFRAYVVSLIGFDPGGTTNWDEDAGWMGHLWNQYRPPTTRPLPCPPEGCVAVPGGPNPNGRLADCAPDETADWKGYNCPQ